MNLSSVMGLPIAHRPRPGGRNFMSKIRRYISCTHNNTYSLNYNTPPSIHQSTTRNCKPARSSVPAKRSILDHVARSIASAVSTIATGITSCTDIH
jgi:hypothetical protein